MMVTLRRVAIFAALVLLPWQARWIAGPLQIRVVEYMAVSLYAVDLLLVAALVLNAREVIMLIRRLGAYPAVLAVMGLVVVGTLVVADEPLLALIRFVTVGLILLFALVASRVVDRAGIRAALIAAAVIEAGFAMTQFLTQAVVASTMLGIAEQLATTPGVSVVEHEAGRFLRAYGTFPHPNILAGFLAIALIAVLDWYFALYEHFQEWWDTFGADHRALWRDAEVRRTAVGVSCALIVFVLIVSALYLTFSRSGVFAAGIGAALFLVLKFRRNFVRASVLGVKVALVAFAVVTAWSFLVPGLWATRTSEPGRLEHISVASRRLQFQDAALLLAEYPFFGVGAANYSPSLVRFSPERPDYAYEPVHNVPVLLFVELGLAGSVLLFYVAYRARRSLRSFVASPTGAALAIALLPLLFLDHYLWTLHAGLLFWIYIVGLAYRRT